MGIAYDEECGRIDLPQQPLYLDDLPLLEGHQQYMLLRAGICPLALEQRHAPLHQLPGGQAQAKHFIDSKEKDKTPEQYDAYNYEISGNGAGTVTVTWPDSLLLSEWVIKDGKQVEKGENNTSSYTFTVDGSTTAVQFQFYKNPAKLNALEKTWDALESSVTVTFIESQAAETSAAN